MTESTILEAFDDLQRTVKEFKSANDDRLAAIEKRGSADPLLEQKVDRIDDAISERMDRLETAFRRTPRAMNDNEEIDKRKNAVEFFSTVRDVPLDANANANVDLEEYRAYRADPSVRLGVFRFGSSCVRHKLSLWAPGRLQIYQE